MRSPLRVSPAVLLLAVVGCSKQDPPPPPAPTPTPPSSSPASSSSSSSSEAKSAGSRWVWMPSEHGTYLAYLYVDKSAGPSAKGGRVIGDPPSPHEIAGAIDFPDQTFRDPVAMDASALTQAELEKLALPAAPPWLSIFEPTGKPNGPLPTPKTAGRPTAKPGMLLQIACGPDAGKVQWPPPGMPWAIGSSVSAPDGMKVEATGVAARHASFSNESGALAMEAVESLVLNGKPSTGKSKLSIGDRIEIGPTTIIVRGTSGWSPPAGSDPSCKGYAERRWLQNGCWKFRRSELLDGAEVIVGSDRASSTFLLGQPGGKVSAKHVRLRNKGGSVEVESLDPAKPPTLKGKPLAKGKLATGDRLQIGDQFVIVLDGDQKPSTTLPLAECPDAGL